MTNSRNKGAAGEREFGAVIFDELGVKLIRNLEQCRSGGCDRVVAGDGPISLRLDRFAIEVKRSHRPADTLIENWWQQAIDQTEKACKRPLLAFRGDRQQWRIIVPLGEVSTSMDERYPPVEWTAWLSVEAFGSLVRESV